MCVSARKKKRPSLDGLSVLLVYLLRYGNRGRIEHDRRLREQPAVDRREVAEIDGGLAEDDTLEVGVSSDGYGARDLPEHVLCQRTAGHDDVLRRGHVERSGDLQDPDVG